MSQLICMTLFLFFLSAAWMLCHTIVGFLIATFILITIISNQSKKQKNTIPGFLMTYWKFLNSFATVVCQPQNKTSANLKIIRPTPKINKIQRQRGQISIASHWGKLSFSHVSLVQRGTQENITKFLRARHCVLITVGATFTQMPAYQRSITVGLIKAEHLLFLTTIPVTKKNNNKLSKNVMTKLSIKME